MNASLHTSIDRQRNLLQRWLSGPLGDKAQNHRQGVHIGDDGARRKQKTLVALEKARRRFLARGARRFMCVFLIQRSLLCGKCSPRQEPPMGIRNAWEGGFSMEIGYGGTSVEIRAMGRS